MVLSISAEQIRHMRKKSQTSTFHFEGFETPHSTLVPDVVFDRLLTKLGEAELKALLYIIRRTFGFKKDRDPVSFNQFLRGITKNGGEVQDEGCGIRDRTTLSKALQALEQKGIIQSEKRKDEHGENVTTIYSLRFRKPPQGEAGKEKQGVVGNSYHGSRNTPPPVVGNSYPQETSKQDVSLSNIRKATSHEVESANAHTVAAEPQPNGVSQFSGSNHTVQRASSPSGVPQRGGEVAHIAQTLQRKHPLLTAPPQDEQAHSAIKSYVQAIAQNLHDEAPLSSSTTRAYNLYTRAGVHLSWFLNLVYDAEKEANRRSATIKKITTRGFKNRMAYFFAVLEDKLGLRQSTVTIERGQKPHLYVAKERG
jgi:hypothetical protein